ncbi:MAG: hypothetical protein A2W35_11485 [Chloroflexi bacterium RBG_16_57_11]|nr:MAG: hypothetical protein A2W35_11485 [Chloroflexi bacterium RBG_16_57_11]
MLTDTALVSVIIPSHNRKAILRQTLDALAKQTYPLEKFEVIVVLDGCTDGSIDMLCEYQAPLTLRTIEQDSGGAAIARNQGASLAKGELLIFLDDDIETSPGFVQAHRHAHLGSNNRVVIGYIPPIPSRPNTYFALELQGWWEKKFQPMQHPGLRFCYTDLLSGNFSIRRVNFYSLGGFNSNFLVHEDYELGARLMKAGLDFAFTQAATGLHHEQPDLNRAMQRKLQEGIADVHLGRIYPELIPTLLICRLLINSRLPSRVLQYLEFRSPRLGKWIALIALQALPVLEKARMLSMWRRFFSGLSGYWYWKGVVQELATQKAVQDFLANKPSNAQPLEKPEFVIDLSQGLDQAEQTLDRLRPDSVSIYNGEKLIGCMPSQPGAERWRGAHLRPFLIEYSLFHLLEAFASQGIIHLPMNIEEFAAFTQKDVPYPERWDQV